MKNEFKEETYSPLDTNGAQFSNLINFNKEIILQEIQF